MVSVSAGGLGRGRGGGRRLGGGGFTIATPLHDLLRRSGIPSCHVRRCRAGACRNQEDRADGALAEQPDSAGAWVQDGTRSEEIAGHGARRPARSAPSRPCIPHQEYIGWSRERHRPGARGCGRTQSPTPPRATARTERGNRFRTRRRLRLRQPQVSKHLKVLASASLVSARADGRNRHYRLDGRGLQEAHAWFGSFEDVWQARFDTLDELVSKGSPMSTTEQGAST